MEELMKELKEVLETEKLITARLVDSVVRSVQLASSITPEMQELYEQWVSIIASQIMREVPDCEIDIPAIAEKIGVKESSLLSLISYMQRKGSIYVQKVTFSKGNSVNEEICDCLKGDN
ncbi:MAG: hypothetical protein FWE49_04110 [Synergistaceae bacterium]|nr:hypothetical protein [Synergistaceae bacterium]